MAMGPQPKRNAMKRGPKSRAGLIPAWVKGAKTVINTATVPPMKAGDRVSAGRPTLHPSVSRNIIVTNIKVPNPSAAMAVGNGILNQGVEKTGFGKYSPNSIAVFTDSGLPRTIEWAVSYPAIGV